MQTTTTILERAAFMEALDSLPGLYKKFSDILALVIGGVGESRDINQAEARTIELTRSLGNEVLTSYAKQVEATASTEALDTRGYDRRGKKKSTSTLRLVK
jgi:hypothetical protein